jgi:hypothetical protein
VRRFGKAVPGFIRMVNGALSFENKSCGCSIEARAGWPRNGSALQRASINVNIEVAQ